MSQVADERESKKKFTDEELLDAVRKADPAVTNRIRKQLEHQTHQDIHRNTVLQRLNNHTRVTGEPWANTTKWRITHQ